MVPEPVEAATAPDKVPADALPGDIDEDAPLAAAVVVETDVDAAAVDEGGPFATFVAADRGPWAVSNTDDEAVEAVEAVDDTSADASLAAVEDEDATLAEASDEAVTTDSEAVDDDAPIAAAVATPDPATGTAPAPRPKPIPSPRRGRCSCRRRSAGRS